MARVRARTIDDPYADIIRWYEEQLLEAPAKVPWAAEKWEPVRIGPTWAIDPKTGLWVLPELSLGWELLAFAGTWLRHETTGDPWRYTLEQARWLLWWYAVDETGRFLFRDGVLQRLKGWGKDPMGATLCVFEAFGPCRVESIRRGLIVPTDVPNAWVQTAAVALEQTKNTMRLLPAMISPEARRQWGIQVGKELVHGLNDTRLIQAVTSSPATLEGSRSTFVLKNETQHWDSSNEGHDMADVIERNVTKAPDAAARTLSITNAYEPEQDSVGQRDREAYESAVARGAGAVKLLYDSLEAPPEAPLSAQVAPSVVRAIRGDSVWLQPEAIVSSILDTRNPPSRSRRFWYNQITAAEDAVFSPQEWDAAADTSLTPGPNAVVTMGLDPSESNDHTALIGCLVEEDHLFDIAFFRPGSDGLIDQAAVDRAVRAAFELYDVVAFYSDVHPFESWIDRWDAELADDLIVKATPKQAVAWDMRRRDEEFTRATERFVAAVIQSAQEAQAAALAGRPAGPRLTHDGSRRFRVHILNARRRANKWGFTVRKETRDSPKKIDATPAAILARTARMDYLALPEGRRRQQSSGRIWGG